MTTIRIEVTQDDIAHSVPEICDRCAVARAMHRALPGHPVVFVTGRFAQWWRNGDTDGEAVRVDLPPSIRRWVTMFDKYGPEGVAPVAFDVEVPA